MIILTLFLHPLYIPADTKVSKEYMINTHSYYGDMLLIEWKIGYLCVFIATSIMCYLKHMNFSTYGDERILVDTV